MKSVLTLSLVLAVVCAVRSQLLEPLEITYGNSSADLFVDNAVHSKKIVVEGVRARDGVKFTIPLGPKNPNWQADRLPLGPLPKEAQGPCWIGIRRDKPEGDTSYIYRFVVNFTEKFAAPTASAGDLFIVLPGRIPNFQTKDGKELTNADIVLRPLKLLGLRSQQGSERTYEFEADGRSIFAKLNRSLLDDPLLEPIIPYAAGEVGLKQWLGKSMSFFGGARMQLFTLNGMPSRELTNRRVKLTSAKCFRLWRSRPLGLREVFEIIGNQGDDIGDPSYISLHPMLVLFKPTNYRIWDYDAEHDDWRDRDFDAQGYLPPFMMIADPWQVSRILSPNVPIVKGAGESWWKGLSPRQIASCLGYPDDPKTAEQLDAEVRKGGIVHWGYDQVGIYGSAAITFKHGRAAVYSVTEAP